MKYKILQIIDSIKWFFQKTRTTSISLGVLTLCLTASQLIITATYNIIPFLILRTISFLPIHSSALANALHVGSGSTYLVSSAPWSQMWIMSPWIDPLDDLLSRARPRPKLVPRVLTSSGPSCLMVFWRAEWCLFSGVENHSLLSHSIQCMLYVETITLGGVNFVTSGS